MLKSTQARRSLSTLLTVAACGGLGAASAAAVVPATVYTQSNDTAANALVALTRSPAGSIAETLSPSRFAAGGTGQSFLGGILDTQGGVELSDDQHLVFAVNAGSDTLSSFRVVPGGGLVLAATVPTGTDPTSVDSHGDIVYVMNRTSATIQGFRAGPTGALTVIAGSTRPFSLGGGSDPAQIGFDAAGRVLTVTHRLAVAPVTNDRIDTFLVDASGVAGPAIANDAEGPAGNNTGQQSFGFAYDAGGHAIVSNSALGTVSSYALNTATGALTFVDSQSSGGSAPCWVVVTPDGRFAFVTNAGSGDVARFSIAANGALTLLGTTAVGGTPTDEVLSPDGALLTVLRPSFGPPTSSTLTLAVGATGTLTPIAGGTSPATLPAGTSGLAASAADASAPDTAITGGLAAGASTNDSTPAFEFAAVPANEPNPTFSCRVDAGASAACTSPFTTGTLGDGAHTVSIGATDFAGNADATPATRAFTVDTVAPETAIVSGPANGSTTSDRRPAFGFTSSEAGSSFRCSVDAATAVACATPFTTAALANGPHTFAVTAIDAAGNADASAATRTFTVAAAVPPPPPPGMLAQPGCPIVGTQHVGDNAANTIAGGAGSDIIFGLGGNDTLRGGANRDCLYGGAGADKIRGGTGSDRLFGGADADRLADSSGRDSFSGGSGADRINARDRSRRGRRVADTVRCGAGRDLAIVDRRDTVARDCERVRRRRA